MPLDRESCYRAVKSRDARFDGRFFTAVRTTGIYCRPVCPARTPLRRNVRFFHCAAAAEEAGFRPCRRCRPDAAPGSAGWQGSSATVARALRLIGEGALDEAGVDALAGRLGIGERHLRRLFTDHLGTSPQGVASSRRAHLARQLIDATRLPMAQVALSSGFRSVRQFNEVVRAVFRQTPSQLRTLQGERPPGATTLRLAYRPPFAWDELIGFLAARAIPAVERAEPGRYLRAFEGGVLEVSPSPARASSLTLTVRGRTEGLLGLVRRVRRLFDLDADPLAIAGCLGGSRELRAAVAARPGLRVPGAWDPFETFCRAILGQQVSVRAATTLCGRLAKAFGAPLSTGPVEGLTHLFPTPRRLARADLGALGIVRARAQAIRAAAARLTRGEPLFEPAADLDALVARLCTLEGVGPWTAHYLAMRVFAEPDAFPAGDLVLRRATGLDERALEARARAWRPWRAYAALHLWTSHTPKEKTDEPRALAS
ncbi:MAG: AlkA N-terminal domain-containing protein [Myxococcaceae bacterium]